MFDGRKVRRHKNRHRIVAAMLELVRDGAISPGAEEVAERAGVGLRTVFRHFDDMESLYREMAEAMRQELQPLVSAPLESPDWKGRLDEMVVRRAVLFERAMPFKNAADVHRHRSVFLRKDYETMRSRRAGRARGSFAGITQKDERIFRGARSSAKLLDLAASSTRSETDPGAGAPDSRIRRARTRRHGRQIAPRSSRAIYQ